MTRGAWQRLARRAACIGVVAVGFICLACHDRKEASEPGPILLPSNPAVVIMKPTAPKVPAELSAAYEKYCTAEAARSMDLMLERFDRGAAVVRPSLWAGATPSLRSDLAAWVSLCRGGGEPIIIVAADNGQLFGRYSRESGYQPAPMD